MDTDPCTREEQKPFFMKLYTPVYENTILPGPKIALQKLQSKENPENNSVPKEESEEPIKLNFVIVTVPDLLPKQQSSIPSQLWESDQNHEPCDICLDEYTEDKFLNLLGCHKFCESCVHVYVQDSIHKGQVLEIFCPHEGCHNKFTDQDISKVTDVKLFDKYKRFQQKQIISKNPNVRWCPRAVRHLFKQNCEKYVTGSMMKTHLVCDCGQHICYSCGNEWHQGLSCKEAEDQSYKDAKREFKIFECPYCKAPIQKRSGCNHMTCGKCKYQFCWLCGGHYTSYHYVVFNVFGCVLPGGQGWNLQPFKNALLLRILMSIPKIILTLLLIAAVACSLPFVIMFLIINAPYRIAKKMRWFRRGIRDYYGCKYLLMWLMYFMLGVVMSPITVTVFAVCLPCIIYYLLAELLC